MSGAEAMCSLQPEGRVHELCGGMAAPDRMGQGIRVVRVVECTDRLLLASTSARAGLGLSSFYCTSVHLPPNYHPHPHILLRLSFTHYYCVAPFGFTASSIEAPHPTAAAKVVPTVHMHRDSATDMLMILKAAVSRLFRGWFLRLINQLILFYRERKNIVP